MRYSLPQLNRQIGLFLCLFFFSSTLLSAQDYGEAYLNADGEISTLSEEQANQEVWKPGTELADIQKNASDGCLDLPPYNRTFATSSLSRGYWFTAQSDFSIRRLKVPTDVGTGPQSIQVVRMDNPPPFYFSTTTATTLFYISEDPSTDFIAVNIPISAGDVIGIIGVRGPGARNSYTFDNINTTTIDIAGVPTTIQRFGTQQSINNNSPSNSFWREDGNTPISRIEMCTEPGVAAIGCEGDISQSNGSTTLQSAGCYYSAPFNADEQIMTPDQLCGDGEIIAQVTSISGSAWAGITLRESIDPGSKKVQLSTNGSNFARREIRTTTNGYAYPQQFMSFGKTWLRLVRNGNQVVGYLSSNGFVWQQVMVTNISLSDCVYASLTLTGATAPGSASATFDNVSITSDAPFTPDSGAEKNLGTGATSPAAGISTAPLDLEVYPNPVADQLNVSFNQPQDADAHLMLINASGQVVKTSQLSDAVRLNLSDLPQGIYTLRVQTATGAPILKRIVVQ